MRMIWPVNQQNVRYVYFFLQKTRLPVIQVVTSRGKCNLPLRTISTCMLDLFNSWRKEEVFTDYVLISSEGKMFPVHKCIISARSEYYKIMLTRWNNGGSGDDPSSSNTLNHVSTEVSQSILNKHIVYLLSYSRFQIYASLRRCIDSTN